MNIFSSIGGFFKKLFGAKGNAVQIVLKDISLLVSLADPIIQGIEQNIKTYDLQDKDKAFAAVVNFLAKYEPDLQKVKDAAESYSKLPVADLLHNVAVFALTKLVPAGTAQSALNLAIELAYSVFKQLKPAA